MVKVASARRKRAISTQSQALVFATGGGGKSKALTAFKWKQPITEFADLQVAAAVLSSRVQQDSAFRKKLDADPLKTLTALGLGNDSIRELIREDDYLRSKLGNDFIDADCTVSCVCTDGCCISCWAASANGNMNQTQLIYPIEFGAADAGLAITNKKSELLKNIMSKGHIIPKFK